MKVERKKFSCIAEAWILPPRLSGAIPLRKITPFLAFGWTPPLWFPGTQEAHSYSLRLPRCSNICAVRAIGPCLVYFLMKIRIEILKESEVNVQIPYLFNNRMYILALGAVRHYVDTAHCDQERRRAQVPLGMRCKQVVGVLRRTSLHCENDDRHGQDRCISDHRPCRSSCWAVWMTYGSHAA